ncbi:hypothetical protein [Streptomyces noursei]|uniref:hypothetical protein n=1 Tax=Streptomyces noursei TaxID=1971 RepID=UPI00069DEEE2|nr:hypothetical protein [Streptomyces noursei]
MKTSRIFPASHASLRAVCTAAVLAGAMAVPTTAFAVGTPEQQDRPASAGAARTAPQATAKDRVRAVGLGGGMEAVIHNGVCDLQAIGSGKPFATLKKGQSYNKGIYVYFDGTHVHSRAQGVNNHDKNKPGPARTVTLTNGARATVQKVNGSYTAKIQLKNKQIATLSSTHRSVTHEGVRYTVNPANGAVAIQSLKKRQGVHPAKHRVIHARTQMRRVPQRRFQAPVAPQAQPIVTEQAQSPVTEQAQPPVTGQVQAPAYGDWAAHHSYRPTGRAGAVAMSFAAAGSGGGR